MLVSVVALLGLGSLWTPFALGQDPVRLDQRMDTDTATVEQVSLSADSLIEILRKEPFLLLEVKRLLIRKAYDQGHLLDETDLSDDALFGLLNRDANIRVLATEEIERRGYLRVLPRKEETNPKQPRASGLDRDSSSEQFYPQREARNPEAGRAREQSGFPDQPQRRREMDERYSRQQGEGSDGEVTLLPRIHPDQLPEILATGEDAHPLLRERRERDERSDSSTSPQRRELPRRRLAGREPPAVPEQPVEQPLIVRRANPYADVPSFHDLYAQVSRHSPVIQRFGADVFRHGTGANDNLPMDLPVGPDYVIGPGDGLMIDLWGSLSQRLQRIVDREGRVALPEVGPILVTGRTLGQVQEGVQAVLRRQFREVQAEVSLSRLRTVRVYVVGDVEHPGAYDISSLSTPLNALYAAGGPTDRGSLRTLRHYRGKQAVQEVDAYDLILRGIRSDVLRLEAGDTVLVPPIGRQVTLEGLVRRPAIYEIKGEKSLFDVLALAGGIMPTGTLRHIDVERVEAHEKRIMLNLDVPEVASEETISRSLRQFNIQDGDRIKIAPILPYTHKTVYLDGHVIRPGKYSYREGMKVADLVKSYSDFLPEPSQRHAEIIRLKEPDFRPVVIAFNLADALSGGNENLALRPFDTVRVFSRYDFEDAPFISVAGEVRRPGQHRTNGETHLRDAIFLAGGLTPDAMTEDAQLFRKIAGSKLKVFSVNLARALAGDPAENILVEPKDRILVHRNLARLDPPTVFIQGEVANPGKYALGEGMTASELVRLAGGFKRGAFTASADLTRTLVLQGQKAAGEHREIEIAKALSGNAAADVVLGDGDTLTIRQLAGWNDIGAAITIRGEVLHPGTYGIREGEKLSAVLKRAGGFRSSAYPLGAVLERVQVR
ncbi:MAG: SLBB domain-containing protein, partial [Acidobacteriota bacterium]